MEFHRGRAPGGVSAGCLTSGKAKGAGHGLGIEAAQAADRGGGAERPEHAGRMKATAAEGRVITDFGPN